MLNGLILSLCVWALAAAPLAHSWVLAGLATAVFATQLRLSVEVR